MKIVHDTTELIEILDQASQKVAVVTIGLHNNPTLYTGVVDIIKDGFLNKIVMGTNSTEPTIILIDEIVTISANKPLSHSDGISDHFLVQLPTTKDSKF